MSLVVRDALSRSTVREEAPSTDVPGEADALGESRALDLASEALRNRAARAREPGGSVGATADASQPPLKGALSSPPLWARLSPRGRSAQGAL
eukprot:4118256-Alexandrium_andersonii.AAC.1